MSELDLCYEFIDSLTSDSIKDRKIKRVIKKEINKLDSKFINYFKDVNHIKYRILRRAIQGFNKQIFSFDDLKRITRTIEGKHFEFLQKFEITLFCDVTQKIR